MFKRKKSLMNAVIVADSVHPMSKRRLTTVILTLPRIVLAELNTHRAFSRNSGSSRAIPFNRMRKSVSTSLFTPEAFQKHHKGMQGTEYYKTGSAMDKLLVFLWWFASKMAILTATMLHMFGATKQLANRILEPFMWHTVIITATEWEGFFRQRCPRFVDNSVVGGDHKEYYTFEEFIMNHKYPDVRNALRDASMSDRLGYNAGFAEIHISLAASLIYQAMGCSTPKELIVGQWHIPFEEEIKGACIVHKINLHPNNMVKIATALCAMVSFTEVGGKSLVDKIIPAKNAKLHDTLIEDEHMSPTEHCAQAAVRIRPNQHSNLKGSWLQYRKIVEKSINRY